MSAKFCRRDDPAFVREWLDACGEWLERNTSPEDWARLSRVIAAQRRRIDGDCEHGDGI